MSNEIFQILKELPTPLMDSQCMLHKHELLICGDQQRYLKTLFLYFGTKVKKEILLQIRNIERIDLPKHVEFGDFSLSNEKIKFNPLLYECDIHKTKIINDNVQYMVTPNDELQKLLYQVIRNGYLCDLITFQYTNNKKEQLCENIKQ
ncbi:hypothetical protein RFI_28996 [Reticulomyxa filosa]|uniref:Uncharacterized protein n=1 Tax=Reticulomyxa filosa TaxID=46433 RepID=X6M5V6_RETFI|nr:hypothetical protein RFI_28996 [Reticulomyxa filosa]|eukprot:ETO08390.1 hypothetical protein RFI_28996 [Reticulomyxa filosa]